MCANRRQGTGLCHAEPIPADIIESQVLDHVEGFVGDAETWLRAQAHERDDGRRQLLQTAQRLRDELADADRRRGVVLADYQAALSEGDATARIVLEVVSGLDSERDALTAQIADAEALASEWEDVGDSGLAESVDLVRALASADTAEALNQAMAKAVAGIHTGITDGRLRAEFALKHPENGVYFFRHAHAVGLAAERITLPDAPAEPCGSPRGNRCRVPLPLIVRSSVWQARRCLLVVGQQPSSDVRVSLRASGSFVRGMAPRCRRRRSGHCRGSSARTRADERPWWS